MDCVYLRVNVSLLMCHILICTDTHTQRGDLCVYVWFCECFAYTPSASHNTDTMTFPSANQGAPRWFDGFAGFRSAPPGPCVGPLAWDGGEIEGGREARGPGNSTPTACRLIPGLRVPFHFSAAVSQKPQMENMSRECEN